MRVLILLAILGLTAYGADFTTYIGDEYPYQVTAIATDAIGNTYVTGSRDVGDVFVTKLDSSGSIVFTTTFGGKGIDQGHAIALDSAGNIWVGGSTSSGNFPLHDALLDISLGGFLVRLAPDGTVAYSSDFYGAVNGVATDASGNVYLTGTTDFEGFPTTPGLPPGKVSVLNAFVTSGAYVTKLDPTGTQILYSALIVGTQQACGAGCPTGYEITSGVGIAVDPAGEAFIAGNTNTTNLPVTAGGLIGYGAFAASINAAGNQLAYLTYLSAGTNLNQLASPQSTTATALAVDASGHAYLTGSTNDPAFPATASAFQATLNSLAAKSGLSNAFAMELDPSGGVAGATYLDGPGPDAATAISLDASGDVWLTGTNAEGFPAGSPFFVLVAGDFLAELSADGSKLLSSMGLGFTGQGVAVDSSGILHLASTYGLVSTFTPGASPASRITGIVNAAQGQVAGRIAPSEIISIFGYGLGPAAPAVATPQNGAFPTALAGVRVLVNGTAVPLLYVSESQINAEIPSPVNGVQAGNATVQVMNGSATLPEFRASVDDSIFGVFLNPDGYLAAINQDGTLNSEANPAKAGSIVSIWATGLPPAATVDGAVANAADNWCLGCQISFGSVTEVASYAGAAPGLIDGVMQINFLIPASVSLTIPTNVTVDFSGLGPDGQFWIK